MNSLKAVRVRLDSLAQDIQHAFIRDYYSTFTHVACHEQVLCVTKGAFCLCPSMRSLSLTCSGHQFSPQAKIGGGGGSRTRVRKQSTLTSTYLS